MDINKLTQNIVPFQNVSPTEKKGVSFSNNEKLKKQAKEVVNIKARLTVEQQNKSICDQLKSIVSKLKTEADYNEFIQSGKGIVQLHEAYFCLSVKVRGLEVNVLPPDKKLPFDEFHSYIKEIIDALQKYALNHDSKETEKNFKAASEELYTQDSSLFTEKNIQKFEETIETKMGINILCEQNQGKLYVSNITGEYDGLDSLLSREASINTEQTKHEQEEARTNIEASIEGNASAASSSATSNIDDHSSNVFETDSLDEKTLATNRDLAANNVINNATESILLTHALDEDANLASTSAMAAQEKTPTMSENNKAFKESSMTVNGQNDVIEIKHMEDIQDIKPYDYIHYKLKDSENKLINTYSEFVTVILAGILGEQPPKYSGEVALDLPIENDYLNLLRSDSVIRKEEDILGLDKNSAYMILGVKEASGHFGALTFDKNGDMYEYSAPKNVKQLTKDGKIFGAGFDRIEKKDSSRAYYVTKIDKDDLNALIALNKAQRKDESDFIQKNKEALHGIIDMPEDINAQKDKYLQLMRLTIPENNGKQWINNVKVDWNSVELFTKSLNEDRKKTINTMMKFVDDQKDVNGIRMTKMANETSKKKDEEHVFIQQYFSLPSKSYFNPGAIRINAQEAGDLMQLPAFVSAQWNVMYPSMMDHYGLKYKCGVISAAKNFETQKQYWGGHNNLRFNRMIESMSMFTHYELAKSFAEFIINEFKKNMPVTTENTTSINIWKKTQEKIP